MHPFFFVLFIGVVFASSLDVSVFEPSKTNQAQMTLMVVCGMHAREGNYTSRVCQSIIHSLGAQRLASNYRVRVVVIPMANPEGFAIASADENSSCWRGNANGVDLNRNFPLVLSALEPPALPPTHPEYPGKHPLSEWETQELDRLLRLYKPDMLISVHSGTLAIFPPYDYTQDKPPTYHRLVQVGKWIRDSMCPDCFVGRSSQYLGYRAYGTMTDYAYTTLDVPLVYTLEVYKGASMEEQEIELTPTVCKKMFTPPCKGEDSQLWLPLFERIYESTSELIEQMVTTPPPSSKNNSHTSAFQNQLPLAFFVPSGFLLFSQSFLVVAKKY